MGGIDLINVMSKTAGMGDENHNRQPAASMYMALQMVQTMMEIDFAHRDEISSSLPPTTDSFCM